MSELFTIKPLEWDGFQYSYRRGWRCVQGGLLFEVWQSATADGWVPQWYMVGPATSRGTPCASPEEGKRLAEEHWREYIKQALTPVGSNAQEDSVTGER